MAWPADWDRGSVAGAIEEASGVSLSANDQLPDTLIAKAQELGLKPIDLKLWIYDSPKPGWTPDALTSWARKNGFTEAPEGEQQSEVNPEFKPPADYPYREVAAHLESMSKACPFYGRNTLMSVGAMVKTFGNQCGLITSSYSPCAMEINHAEPRWELCLRNPDNNGTGATG